MLKKLLQHQFDENKNQPKYMGRELSSVNINTSTTRDTLKYSSLTLINATSYIHNQVLNGTNVMAFTVIGTQYLVAEAVQT